MRNFIIFLRLFVYVFCYHGQQHNQHPSEKIKRIKLGPGDECQTICDAFHSERNNIIEKCNVISAKIQFFRINQLRHFVIKIFCTQEYVNIGRTVCETLKNIYNA